MGTRRHVLVLGAGASLAAPAERPLFAWLRAALIARLNVGIDAAAWAQMAPEALLSRLASAGVDVDQELRRMLAGGAPNAVHAMAAEVLRRGGTVWTTNLDELIEAAADQAGIEYHRLLPDDDVDCACACCHVVKVHGTLSAAHVLARSEEVLLPLPPDWRRRLADDFRDASVALVGYAGADIDLRAGLRDALGAARRAVWFGTSDDDQRLRRRFAGALATGALELRISDRPDLAALEWGREHDLTVAIPATLWRAVQQPVTGVAVAAAEYRPDDLLRARVLDDFGRGAEARRLYRRALLRGPRRRRAARSLYSSGLIHGAPWRRPALALLDTACAMPLPWRWPHRQRLPYLTWNVPPDERLPKLERSLARVGDDPDLVLSAANAAKEVDPRRGVELAARARDQAVQRRDPPDAAWATFTLSLAFRWLGDLTAADEEATRLADGYDALAGPVWVAWGHFEAGAVAALRGELAEAQTRMRQAVEVFTAAGSMFTFDAWCGALAVHRAAGDRDGRDEAYSEARRLLDAGSHRRRFKREVLMVEEGELAREQGRLADATAIYTELSHSPTLAQQLLGLLGLGEVQRQEGVAPSAAWEARRRSRKLSFGYGEVHAAVTLGLAGAISIDEADRQIESSVYDPPVRDDAAGLLRYCQGPVAGEHLLCFP
jgi:tetratricopeptide (TPR) repeat protein